MDHDSCHTNQPENKCYDKANNYGWFHTGKQYAYMLHLILRLIILPNNLLGITGVSIRAKHWAKVTGCEDDFAGVTI